MRLSKVAVCTGCPLTRINVGRQVLGFARASSTGGLTLGARDRAFMDALAFTEGTAASYSPAAFEGSGAATIGSGPAGDDPFAR